MSSSKAAWGIEVGAYGIKAIRLEREGDEATLTDFAVIPHKKVLTTPDLDQDEMIRIGLGQFVSQKSVQGERAVVSVPGNAAFARFAKLPPVEPRKVPDIVKFEAVQQIPFPIEEVEWDYETVQASDSPEIEVGIFAITKERSSQRLALYQELGINPDFVTLSPLAVFNALAYDLKLKDSKKPVVFLDIGTTATDLIVADEGRCWIRTFPLGGTHFTEAIAESFKLSYGKAEALKQDSATSKYAKQIMQAMRPVFTDLLSDVQKSLNYYQQLHRGVTLDEVIGLGSTFKIPGLRKFLSQQLNLEVKRLDEFQRIRPEGREAADFAASTVNMATAYGLALQGVGLATIDVNLAPVKALRDQLWAAKTKWFAAAAALAVLAGGAMFLRGILDRAALSSSDAATTDRDVMAVVSTGKTFKSEYQRLESEANLGFTAENLRRLTDDRRVWPQLIDDVSTAVRSGGPQPQLYSESRDEIIKVPAVDRRAILLTNLRGTYKYENNKRRIDVEMDVEFSNRDKQGFLNETVAKWLRDNADIDRPGVPYRIVKGSISINTDRLLTFTDDGSGKSKRDMDALADAGNTTDVQAPVAPPMAPITGPPAGGGSGGIGGGAVPGKRAPTGDQIKRPGPGGLGNSANPGGVAPPSEIEQDPSGTSRGGSYGTGGNPEAESKFNLNELAPIPFRPSLYQKDEKYYTGKITFSIELSQPSGAASAAGADAATPQKNPT